MIKFSINKIENHYWLAFLRCSISLIALLHFMVIQWDFDLLFSQNGFVKPDIGDVLSTPILPTINGIYNKLIKITAIDYNTILWVFRVLYPISLILLFVGFFTRTSAILCLVLQLIIKNSMEAYAYGVDEITTIALFYCAVLPVGKMLSLDARKSTLIYLHQYSTIFLRIFQAHICVIYFFSGFEKMLGYNWRNGESMWRMVHGYNTTSFINLDFLYNTPFFAISGWASFLLELLYPLFINYKKTRKVWLIGIVIFHASIAFFMGLYFFSAVMILLNVTAYYVPYLKIEEDEIKSFNNKSFFKLNIFKRNVTKNVT